MCVYVCTVLFDKMLVLNEGKFKLSHLGTVGAKRSREAELRLLAAMEAPSSHPLAEPLVDVAKYEGVKMVDPQGP